MAHNGHKARHRQHANPFTVRRALSNHMLDWPSLYRRQAPMALDIGFGAGGFLLALAQQQPQWNVLGLEIRPHLVAAANAQAQNLGLNNMIAILANANMHLDTLVPDGSIRFVALNFPDPWYKRRHHKRRVVKPAWVAQLIPKLAPKAQIHAMSDYAPLAHEILAILQTQTGLHNLAGHRQFATASTTGIQTERELKHQKRGEPIYRIKFAYDP